MSSRCSVIICLGHQFITHTPSSRILQQSSKEIAMSTGTGTYHPYEDMDPDDPNYIHGMHYDQVHELINSLPSGWIRLDPSDLEPGQPPYLHEPTGKTSYRSPNFDKVMDLANATHEEGKRKHVGSNEGYAKKVKKLRLMLQAGAPLGAVEQKAKLEGIDISVVLSPKSGGDGAEQASVTDDEGELSSIAIPVTLEKKYKRMFKAGVPLDRIQQLAGVETSASPEKVASLLRDCKGKEKEETESNAESVGSENNDAVADSRMIKFVRMQKAGIPVVAIQNSARLQGYDVDELNVALGIKVESAITKKDEESENVKASTKEIGIAVAEQCKTDPSYFTPLSGKGQVAFRLTHNESTSPLTELVRKMSQTVEKTVRFDGVTGAAGQMIVSEATLYNALGALKGVQFALDEYNSTIGMKGDGFGIELAHSKRHGFAEMARSIGMVNDNESATIEGLDELIVHIEHVNKHELERGYSLLKDGFYDFDSLHCLYPPGSFVIAKHAGGGGIDCFAQVIWSHYNQGKTIMGKPMKYFQMCVRYIVPIGGGKSTFAEVVEGMESFEGRRSLANSGGAGMGLKFVPPSEDERCKLMKRYSLRGERYNSIASSNEGKEGNVYSYLQYDKGCFFQKRSGAFTAGKASAALASSGRIVVDMDSASEQGHSISVGRDDLIQGIQLKLKEYKLHLRSIEQAKSGSNGNTVSSGDMVLFTQVPKEYLALVWPSMVGFSLTAKSWGDVMLDGLNEIAFDPDVFDRLVLSESRKRMIKALVKHTNAEGGFQDIVKGKGEGTVFLLYGVPGTGKTLTAEAISELLHRPLYSVSMGTLGTTADELERRIGEILQLSAKWNALILLDEADSFLEARSSNSSLERNSMVSVMLRLVEYHQGILFLTSNRIDSLDSAFRTRITLALKYEALDVDGRKQVWSNLLETSGFGSKLDSFDVKALAVHTLNGREVKNSLRLAMALAADNDGDLTQELLMEAATVVNGYKESMTADWNKGESAKSRRWTWSWWWSRRGHS